MGNSLAKGKILGGNTFKSIVNNEEFEGRVEFVKYTGRKLAVAEVYMKHTGSSSFQKIMDIEVIEIVDVEKASSDIISYLIESELVRARLMRIKEARELEEKLLVRGLKKACTYVKFDKAAGILSKEVDLNEPITE